MLKQNLWPVSSPDKLNMDQARIDEITSNGSIPVRKVSYLS